jgi:tRNA U34 5-carboxymethylaminomethyl modifying enzyme MnmG/GidA
MIQTTDINARTEIRVHASPGSVMAALSQVYPDLGIPIGTAISASGQIGNKNYRVPGHRLKSTQLSQILECGQGSVTGSRADLDEVTIDVLSTIKSDGDTASVVSTFLTASARPLGSSSDAVICATNSRLEQMISAHLQQSLAGS